MTPDALFTLHERLVGDNGNPFDSLDGTGHIRLRAAGEAWLRDLAAYQELREQIGNKEADRLLHARYGYVVDAMAGPAPEVAEDPRDANGRRSRRFGWAKGIDWYEARERRAS